MEAYVVAMVDDLDSKLNTMQRLFDMEMEGAGNWGRFSPLFDRYFYLGAYRKKMAERND
jgi:3'-5' exoribonuclease